MSCDVKKIEIHGHRGCRGLLPENSIPGFKKAIELGVDVIEFDVVITKDLKVLVSHEPFMNHEICLQPNGLEIKEAQEKDFNIYEMKLDEVTQFDCGSKVHPRFPEQEKVKVFKPTLLEVIKTAEALNEDIKYNIELKSLEETDNTYHPEPEEFVSLVLEIINNANIESKTVLQSFDIRILEVINRKQPSIETSLLIDENESIEKKLAMLSFQPDILSPYFKLLNDQNVKDYQNKSFKVIPWTVNTIEDMELMIELGVDGLISDYPDLLIEILNK
ncbi:MAG: glycerophosphodiester phosphodiesterase [bacterium]